MVLRALFGIGMGGEWGVGASLAMEKVPPRLRGVLSGLLQEGYAAGNLLASLCYFFVFPRWGWRPLFFIGGLPALLALFVRFRVKESEVWKIGTAPLSWFIETFLVETGDWQSLARWGGMSPSSSARAAGWMPLVGPSHPISSRTR